MLTQSPAIIEWLEERHSEPPLLPKDAINRVVVRSWISRWIGDGFAALETMVRDHGTGHFCCGDHPTIADCYLIPQICNARSFGVDLAAFPWLVAVDAHCTALDAFARAAPDRQPDADRGDA